MLTARPEVPGIAILLLASLPALAAAPGPDAPTPADPYPLTAAGWGTDAGNGLMTSRWVEDWTGMRAAGHAPSFKAIPLGGEASLTLSTEERLRHDFFDNGQLLYGNDYQQDLFRGIAGADLHFNSDWRVYGEIGTGQVEGRRSTAGPNLQNISSLQQLFVDMREYIDTTLVGAMFGRQEFADGPRQLVSVGDGSNLHRTWNGLRLYAHGGKWRVGVFNFRLTRQERGSLDEEINNGESLRGINASVVIGANSWLDPFWIHSENRSFKSGTHTGLDQRDTLGLHWFGQQGDLKYDWTLAQQTGDYMGRDIKAWALFAVDSLALSGNGWKPRLTSHIDIASGGGSYGTGKVTAFDPLYASSNYLGDGQFFSLNNLLLIAPGIAVSPTSRANVTLEYGFARRLNQDDAVYAGGLRVYSGTQNVKGHDAGGLLRFYGTYAASEHLTMFFNYEQLAAGDVLKQAKLGSGKYGYVGATFRY